MMIVPINTDINEAKYIANEDRNKRFEAADIFGMRYFQLQDHDGNDDGKYTIAKSFESGFPHLNEVDDGFC